MYAVRDLSTTALRALSLDDVVYCHLSTITHIPISDFKITSCLDGIETEMRQSRGVQLTSNYAPLLAGFAILDQIGSCYRDTAKAAHPNQGGAIHRALYYFMGLVAMSDDVKALYALRNGLVHDASLTCKTHSGDWYIFRYNYEMQASVKAAKIPWDGSAANLNRDSLTLINPRFFTDQISDALHVLRSCYFDRRTDLDILKSADDILHKYLFWQSSSP